MLLQQTIQHVETREIALPYHCKTSSLCSSSFYRVNEDESVLAITMIDHGEYAHLAVHKKPTDYLRDLISKATPCESIEVQDAKNKALEIMDTILTNAIA